MDARIQRGDSLKVTKFSKTRPPTRLTPLGLRKLWISKLIRVASQMESRSYRLGRERHRKHRAATPENHQRPSSKQGGVHLDYKTKVLVIAYCCKFRAHSFQVLEISHWFYGDPRIRDFHCWIIVG